MRTRRSGAGAPPRRRHRRGPARRGRPRRSSTRTGRSRLTGSPAGGAEVGAASVSSLTSATHQPSPCSTTVRQQPFTAMESPGRILEHHVAGQREPVGSPPPAAELLDDAGEHQCITIPPVTLMAWPVQEAASSEASQRTTPATSATLWRRPSGDPAIHADDLLGRAGVGARPGQDVAGAHTGHVDARRPQLHGGHTHIKHGHCGLAGPRSAPPRASPTLAAMLAMLTIRPRPARIMTGATAWMTNSTERAFVARTWSHSSGEMSSSGALPEHAGVVDADVHGSAGIRDGLGNASLDGVVIGDVDDHRADPGAERCRPASPTLARPDRSR